MKRVVVRWIAWSRHSGARLLVLCVLLVAALPALAAERVALVIGNDQYQSPASQSGRGVPPLNNARNDARAVAAKLRADPLGFEVIEAHDLTQEQMAEKLADFGQRLTSPGRVGFFFYAGHGAQVRLGVGSEVRDENLLMGVDVDISTTVRLEKGSLKLSDVLSSMRGAGRPVNVVVLDACRDNPALDSRGSRGLAPVGSTGSGFLIQFATAANQTTADGLPGGNGVYTRELLTWLDRPGLSLGDVFTEVAGAVKRNTRQEPWMSSTIGERVFLAGREVVTQPSALVPAGEGELRIEVSPAGATVRLDGVLLGTGSRSVKEVAGRTVVVRAEAEGHEALEERVRVQGGQVADVVLRLRAVPAPIEGPVQAQGGQMAAAVQGLQAAATPQSVWKPRECIPPSHFQDNPSTNEENARFVYADIVKVA